MSFSSKIVPAILKTLLVGLAGAAILTGCVNEPTEEGRAWSVGTNYGSVSDREWR